MIIGEGEVMHKQTNRKVSFSSLHIYLPVNGVSSDNTAPPPPILPLSPRGPVLIKNQLNFLCSIIFSYFFTIICLDLCLKGKKDTFSYCNELTDLSQLGIRKEGSDWDEYWKKKGVQGKMALCPNVTPVVEKTLFKNWVGEWIGWWRKSEVGFIAKAGFWNGVTPLAWQKSSSLTSNIRAQEQAS